MSISATSVWKNCCGWKSTDEACTRTRLDTLTSVRVRLRDALKGVPYHKLTHRDALKGIPCGLPSEQESVRERRKRLHYVFHGCTLRVRRRSRARCCGCHSRNDTAVTAVSMGRDCYVVPSL